jgi:site-specific DNA-methyltransferase (adenine-specific)
MEIIPIDENRYLPSSLLDLTQFVLVGRDKLNMVRAGIRAMDKLDVAEGVRKQKKEEAHMLAEALLDAEVRIGEILEKMPKSQGKRTDLQHSNSTVTMFETKEHAVKELGFDKMQVSRFQTLAQNKDLVEQIKQDARDSDDLPTRTSVLQAVRIRDLENNREQVRQNLVGIDLTLTDKKYSLIYADPPWMYDGGKPLSDKYGDVQKHYPPMETLDICNLPVNLLANKDCVLFLWATAPKLPEALEVMKAWGFQYKTCIVWDKVKHNFGFYFSVRHELLLIGGIGKSTPDNTSELHDSVISIERSKIHSEKPEYFRELLSKMYKGNKIELFARVKSQNWDVWGNQA